MDSYGIVTHMWVFLDDKWQIFHTWSIGVTEHIIPLAYADDQ
jgi:hypothetical protein